MPLQPPEKSIEDLLKIFNLEKDDVYSFKLNIEADSVATVEVGMFLQKDQLGKIITVLKSYELIEKKV